MALVKRDNQFSVATIQESTKEQNRTNIKVLDEETYVQVGHARLLWSFWEIEQNFGVSIPVYGQLYSVWLSVYACF